MFFSLESHGNNGRFLLANDLEMMDYPTFWELLLGNQLNISWIWEFRWRNDEFPNQNRGFNRKKHRDFRCRNVGFPSRTDEFGWLHIFWAKKSALEEKPPGPPAEMPPAAVPSRSFGAPHQEQRRTVRFFGMSVRIAVGYL